MSAQERRVGAQEEAMQANVRSIGLCGHVFGPPGDRRICVVRDCEDHGTPRGRLRAAIIDALDAAYREGASSFSDRPIPRGHPENIKRAWEDEADHILDAADAPPPEQPSPEPSDATPTPAPPEAREERTLASLWIDERSGKERRVQAHGTRRGELGCRCGKMPDAVLNPPNERISDRRAADRGRGARRETEERER